MLEALYTRKLTEWAMSRFKWSGLPPTVDERFLERILLEQGFIVFYLDPRFNRFLVARAASQGYRNLYDNPTKFRTMSAGNYRGIELTSKDCVPIYASMTRQPIHDVIRLYARRLADIDVSLDVNARNMRFNKLAVAEEGNRLTVQNALQQIDMGEPTIFVNAGFDLASAIQTLDISTHPDVLDRLRIEKNQVWNECATMLGITNSNQDKKERMVADEATGSDGSVIASRNSELKPRLWAAEQINTMYPGLNVSVEWDYNSQATPDMHMNMPDEGRENSHDHAEHETERAGRA